MRKLVILLALSAILTACEQKVVVNLPQNSVEEPKTVQSSATASASAEAGPVFTASQLAELPVMQEAPENMSPKEEYAYWEKMLSKQPGYDKEKKACEAQHKMYKLKIKKTSTLLSSSTDVHYECE